MPENGAGHVSRDAGKRCRDIGGCCGKTAIWVEMRGGIGYEREIAEVYVGALRDGPAESGSVDLRLSEFAHFLFGRMDLLSSGNGSDGLCVFSHVLQKCKQTFAGEPEIPEAGDEGAGIFWKNEAGHGPAERISYL